MQNRTRWLRDIYFFKLKYHELSSDIKISFFLCKSIRFIIATINSHRFWNQFFWYNDYLNRLYITISKLNILSHNPIWYPIFAGIWFSIFFSIKILGFHQIASNFQLICFNHCIALFVITLLDCHWFKQM